MCGRDFVIKFCVFCSCNHLAEYESLLLNFTVKPV